MQITPVEYPHPPSYIPNTLIHRQQLTPAPSLVDEPADLHTQNGFTSGTGFKLYRQRSNSDPERHDDYYFYHTGRMSRRSSIQSLGRRTDDDPRSADPRSTQPQPTNVGTSAGETVRLPPITSLFAAVERTLL
jgi:hypothetical protein